MFEESALQEKAKQELIRNYSPFGKAVVVTGGTQGIGRTVVCELGTLGARCDVEHRTTIRQFEH